MKRWLKYKYLELLRAKGGPTKVAKGFSIGLAIEMFTLPTMGIAFFLIFPLVYFFRASLAGAMVGFVFGKIIYIPFSFMNNRVGAIFVTKRFEAHLHSTLHFLPNWLEAAIVVNMKLIVGGMLNGVLLGLLMFFPIKWLLQAYATRRLEKRKQKKMKMIAKENNH